MSHHENASMINHEESSSSSSKSPVPTAKSDELKIARDEFIHTVARTIQRIKEENGYNCDRATNLILRELTASTTTTNHHGWEDELNNVKQRYHLTHQQASRAYAVSLAIKKLVQEDGKLSVLESVRYLTEKLANATFVRTTEGSEPRFFSSASESSSTCQILTTTTTPTTTTPASGIRLPEMPKQQPQSTLPERRSTKSPSKRLKSSSSASKATNTKGKQSLTAKSTRKRSLEEMASTGSSSTQPSLSSDKNSGKSDKNSGSSSDSSRHRSDSVTEAVSAKMMQNNNNDPSSSVVNSEKQTTARTKRRSTGSLDEAEAGPVNKRGRTTSTA